MFVPIFIFIFFLFYPVDVYGNSPHYTRTGFLFVITRNDVYKHHPIKQGIYKQQRAST